MKRNGYESRDRQNRYFVEDEIKRTPLMINNSES